MTINIDRRQLMALGTFGLGALSVPASATLTGAKGFTHGVASGEPDANSVLLWTRYVGTGDSQITAEVSTSSDFAGAKTVGETNAGPRRDYTAKIVADGLLPGTWYFYRFVAPDGTRSPIGRTRPLPDGPASRFNIGVFSCSNLPFGYFNAYAHAAQRNDLDLLIHTGDYLYEYPVGSYPSKKQALAGRIIAPDHEMVELADYRLRYAAYRSDPDLQRLHQLFPMISMWDDHETANDAHKDGAQNHQPATEGDWQLRKKVAERVYREWMPVRDRAPGEPIWSEYQVGDLATIFLTESRISGRDAPASIAEALRGEADIEQALKNFRDGEWQNPDRHMLGAGQQTWLAGAMTTSKRAGTKWQVLAQQCVMGTLLSPPETEQWVADDAPPFVKARTAVGLAASKVGLPFNMDAWDGYPVARERLLKNAQAADADLLVLSGDSHNAWAFDLATDGQAAGVEFAGQSVTSPGFENYIRGAPPKDVAAALMKSSSDLQWADTSHRGYMTVSLTPEMATSTWHFLETVRQKSIRMKGQTVHAVAHGSRQLNKG